MLLKTIDKERYRRNSRNVYFAIVAWLILVTLASSTAFIYLFSDPQNDNFIYNLAGVVTAVLGLLVIWSQLKSRSYLADIEYIRQLKSLLNRINRKLAKLEKAAKTGDINAFISLDYSYKASRLIWELDNNTLLMSELQIREQKLSDGLAKFNLSIDDKQFNPEMLSAY
ncbi:DUF3087 family protein [Alginatibacterium sediminis]|uniref:DUF3087 family protein n=1 Tax=Alginatibacterium sediminis TaxID=2164068 RepID=A0A420EH77_9ALTE|nr:DUF3087 family protein [Alginatibacterium sediminis]RKF19906.1 DUF3087 family protein [Alginatibacterium sediminis]